MCNLCFTFAQIRRVISLFPRILLPRSPAHCAVACEKANAREHDELPQYRESYQANIACKGAIETAIGDNYRDNRLNSQAVMDTVSVDFSMDRISYVLTNTVQFKDHDGRISNANKQWAKSILIVPNADSWGGDRNCYFVVDRVHTGRMDLFVTHFRKEMEKAPKEKKPSVLDKLSKPLPEVAVKPGKSKEQELVKRHSIAKP